MKADADTQVAEWLDHIADWGQRLAVFIEDREDFTRFVSDQLVYLAAWKCVEVIGEASSRILKLRPDMENDFPGLALRDAYAMRNRLTHGYSDVDLQLLWNTCVTFVPRMVEAAEAAGKYLREAK